MRINAGCGGLACSRDDHAGRSRHRRLRAAVPTTPLCGQRAHHARPGRQPTTSTTTPPVLMIQGQPHRCASSPTKCITIRGAPWRRPAGLALTSATAPKCTSENGSGYLQSADPARTHEQCSRDVERTDMLMRPRPASLRGALPCRLGHASLSDRPASALPARGCCAAGRTATSQ